MIRHQQIDIDVLKTRYCFGFGVSPNGSRFCGTYFVDSTTPNLTHGGEHRGLTFNRFNHVTREWGFEDKGYSGASGLSARAINDQGDIAGYFVEPSKDPSNSSIGKMIPYIWRRGTAEPFAFKLRHANFDANLLAASVPNCIFAINNEGYVAGVCTIDGMQQGFVARNES